MGERVKIDLASQKKLVWKNRNLDADLASAADKIRDDDARQRQLLQSKNRHIAREFLSALAFNLDTTEEELRQTIAENPQRYGHIRSLAVELVCRGVSPECGVWEEAKKIIERKMASGEVLLDKISRYQNSRKPASMYPKEPGPPRIYDNRHKKRKPRTKQQIYDTSQRWAKWQEFNNLVNSEDLDNFDLP